MSHEQWPQRQRHQYGDAGVPKRPLAPLQREDEWEHNACNWGRERGVGLANLVDETGVEDWLRAGLNAELQQAHLIGGERGLGHVHAATGKLWVRRFAGHASRLQRRNHLLGDSTLRWTLPNRRDSRRNVHRG